MPDRDRPLNDRGLRDAPRVGERLAKRDARPDLILSSPARRALTTASMIARKVDYKTQDIVVDERLYAANPDDLFEVVRNLGNKWHCVMLIGHNPELTELAHRLSAKITDMPTCAVAVFTYDVKSWSNLGEQEPATVRLHCPKKS